MTGTGLLELLLENTVELTAPVFSATDRFEAGTRGVVRTIRGFSDGSLGVKVVAPDGRAISGISIAKVQVLS